MTTTTLGPVLICRLSGRGANGAERDGGRRLHVVPHVKGWQWGKALCGAKPGRRSNGWDEVDGAEQPTCPRCATRAERLLAEARPGGGR
jgi:hypothetical protein